MEQQRKRGRPLGYSPGRQHEKQVNVYMSAASIAAIDAARGAASRSAFIRQAALDKAKKTR